MSSTTIDNLGIHRVRLDQRLADFIAAFQVIYGSDINVDPDTVDGQFLGIVSEMAADADALLEQIYLARSPASSVGADLSRLVQLIGITRNVASASTANVTFGGVAGTVIPSGSLVDTTDQPPAHFQTVGDVTLDGFGNATGVVRATTTGPVFAPAGLISVIKTVISGWSSVTNPAAVNLGSNQETDVALRVRRAASVAINSKSIVDGIYAALANIQGVSEAVVFENRTASPIARLGSTDLPPNAIQCVVRGGLDGDIAAAIFAKVSAGVTLVGATSATVIDTQGTVQVIKFDRPTPVAIFAAVAMRGPTALPASAAFQAAVRQALVDYGTATVKIGQVIIRTRLFSPVTDIVDGSGFSIDTIKIGTSALGVAELDIAIPFTGIASWDPSLVTISITRT